MDGPVEEGKVEPARDNDKEVKVWEKPWTVAEIRSGANRWSLAGDAGMLQHLQQFSHQLLAQTHSIEDKLSHLVHQTKLANVQLDNVFNDFIMLANTQFVENRVYDDDVTENPLQESSQKEQKEKTSEEREAELIPRIQEALSLGLNVIDSAFEKLDINEANSSDDEDDRDTHQRTDLILEPKDPYLHRPLPHLIGSLAFHQDDNVGLSEFPSDDEADEVNDDVEESDEDSESESDSDASFDKEPAHAPTKQHEQYEWPGSESESGSDLFEEDGDGEEEEFVKDPDSGRSSPVDHRHGGRHQDREAPPARVAKERNFNDELSAKIGAPPGGKSLPSVKREKKKSHVQEEDLFQEVQAKVDSDGEMDDESPFSQSRGRFSKTSGLFDEEEEEGDLFADSAPATTPQSSSRGPTERRETPSQAPTSRAPPQKPRVADLFDEEEEEEDLFAAPSAAKAGGSRASSRPTRPEADIFADDTKDLFPPNDAKVKDEQPEAAAPVPKKKLPAGAVSMFGAAGNPMLAAMKQRRSESESTEGEGERRSSSPESGASRASGVDRSRQIPKASRERSLEPDAADKFIAKTPALKAQPKTQTTFDKAPNRDRKAKTVAPSGGLFDDDDDLFGDVKPAPVSQGTKAKKIAPAKVAPSGGGLFDDDEEEEDLFAALKPKPTANDSAPKANKPSGGTLLFEEDEDDIFGSLGVPATERKPVTKQDQSDGEVNKATKSTKPTPEVTKQEAKPDERPQKKVISLFADEETDEVDLFAAIGTGTNAAVKSGTSLASDRGTSRGDSVGSNVVNAKSKQPEPVKTPKSRSLFEDDALLFGGEVQNPDVDLFGAGSPLHSPTKQDVPRVAEENPDPLAINIPVAEERGKPSQPTKASSSQKQVTVEHLFGSPGDDEDIFSVSSATKTTEKKARESFGAKAATTRGGAGGGAGGGLFHANENGDDLFGTLGGGKVEKKKQKENSVDFLTSSSSSASISSSSSSMFSAPAGEPFSGAMATAVPSLDPTPAPSAGSNSFSAVGGGEVEGPVPGLGPLPTGTDGTDWGFSSKSSKPVFAATVKPRHPKPKPTPSLAATESPLGGAAVGSNGPGTSVGSIKTGLAIDPRRLVPGASPPVAKETAEGADFEEPIRTATLVSATKSRARVDGRRRPPSRRVRGEPRAAASGLRVTPEWSMGLPPHPGQPHGVNHNPLLFGAPGTPSHPLPPSREEPFTPRQRQGKRQLEADDIFGLSPDGGVGGGGAGGGAMGVGGGWAVGGGRVLPGGGGSGAKHRAQFQPPTSSDVTSAPFLDSNNKFTADLFGESAVGDNATGLLDTRPEANSGLNIPDTQHDGLEHSGTTNQKAEEKSKSAFSLDPDSNDDDEDLFAGSILDSKSREKRAVPKSDRPPAEKAMSSATPADDDLFNDDDDDVISGGRSSSGQDVQRPSSGTSRTSGTSGTSGSSGTFGDSGSTASPRGVGNPVVAKATREKKSVAKVTKTFDIFGDDDEDIFASGSQSSGSQQGSSTTGSSKTGSSKTGSSKTGSSKGASSKPGSSQGSSASFLSDTRQDSPQDLFADLQTTSKSGGKKPTKAKAASSIFSDNIDDIFKDTTIKVTKTPTQPKAVTSRRPTKAPVDNIFDDDDEEADIFADPLKATKH